MKICIISYAHLETAIPLAKYLSKDNEVTLICIFDIKNTQNDTNIELKGKSIRLDIVDKFESKTFLGKELQEYINNNFSFNLLIFSNYYYGKISFIRTLIKLNNFINKLNPDIINITGHAYFLKMLHLSLWRYPRVHTAHEVVAHDNRTDFSKQSKMFHFLSSKNQYFIFPSKITRIRFHEKYVLGNDKTKQIYFGKFELYELYKSSNIKQDSASILFLGNILKYKGIDYLLESAQICNKKIPNFKLIIAGKGNIDSKDWIQNTKYIEIINRRITNYEFAELIQRCRIVVCPYTSASSSGIPMSAYVFNKPVIASDVEGLNEVIFDLKTGLLVPPKNSQALADAIEKLLLNNELYDNIENNLKKNNYLESLDWDVIANETLAFYKHVIKSVGKNKSKFNNYFLNILVTGLSCLKERILDLVFRLINKIRLI